MVGGFGVGGEGGDEKIDCVGGCKEDFYEVVCFVGVGVGLWGWGGIGVMVGIMLDVWRGYLLLVCVCLGMVVWLVVWLVGGCVVVFGLIEEMVGFGFGI